MKRHVLCILSDETKWPLVASSFEEEALKAIDFSMILLQDDIRVCQIPYQKIGVVKEDIHDRAVQSWSIKASYRDILEKIFSSDSVFVL